MTDIRWKQRYVNFEKAFKKLEKALEKEELNELEKIGLFKRFEFTLDLAWKTLKDFLVSEGFQFKPSPKETIRQAQQASYIDFAQDLIDAIELRNLLSHNYDETNFIEGEEKIREVFFFRLDGLFQFLESQLNRGE